MELIINFNPDDMPSFLSDLVIQKNKELIRCKDCKWNKSEGDWTDCKQRGMFGRCAADNYCSMAERKDNDRP